MSYQPGGISSHRQAAFRAPWWTGKRLASNCPLGTNVGVDGWSYRCAIQCDLAFSLRISLIWAEKENYVKFAVHSSRSYHSIRFHFITSFHVCFKGECVSWLSFQAWKGIIFYFMYARLEAKWATPPWEILRGAEGCRFTVWQLVCGNLINCRFVW